MFTTIKLSQSLAPFGVQKDTALHNAGSLINYSIDEIKDEVRHLVEIGKINIHQPIQVLCKFIPPRVWLCVECELERNDYLLGDHICDLLAHDEWSAD